MSANPSFVLQSTSASAGKLQNLNSKRSSAALTVGGTKSHLPATARVLGCFKNSFGYQFVRTVWCVTCDGAAVGECYETGSRIAYENDESNSASRGVTLEGVEAP